MGHYGQMFLRHPILSLATLLYLGLVGWVTLTPQAASRNGVLWQVEDFLDSVPLLDRVSVDQLEFAANVAMFIPFGIFFVLLLGRRRWWVAVLMGMVLTVGIEFAQQFIPYRVSDVRDLVSNTMGTVIGTLLALLLTAAKARADRQRVAALAGSRSPR
jgi:glycopeptide antibiotics resistance protein